MGLGGRLGVVVLGVGPGRAAAKDMVEAIRERRLSWDGCNAVYSVPEEHRGVFSQVKVVITRGGACDNLFTAFPMLLEGGCARIDPVVVQAIDAVPEDRLEAVFSGGYVWDSIALSPVHPSWLSDLKARA